VAYFIDKCSEEKVKKISEGDLLDFILGEELNSFISDLEDGKVTTYSPIERLNDNLYLIIK